jgi:hypothetical protein
MAKLREICLGIRKALLEIELYSIPTARINQLNDLLVLWAYTLNFSYAREYYKLTADPITVVARELGTNIPRSKIFATYGTENNRKQQKAGKANATRSKAKTIKNSSSTEDLTEITPVEEEGYADTTLESIDPPSPATKGSSNSNNKDSMEVVDQIVITEDSVTTAEGSSTDGKVDPIVMEVDTITETADHEEAEEPEDSVKKAKAETKMATTPRRDMNLSPNEPVFEGSKIYPSLFCFWQLIGWFNAGTDQAINAPELFGCTQLPEPEQCFGVSETSYGEKQRETLLEILMDEKRQTMPWPQSLKSSFSFPEGTQKTRKPLFGSPMLDIALGQVDAVIKVLRELKFQKVMTTITEKKKFEANLKKEITGSGDKKRASSGKSAKENKKLSLEEATQYDNILPPELPTSWVQCESCKKWRRVAWNVDVESLPEAWTCPMNSWDLDNANCDAPQDSFDPAKENTFDYKAPANVTINTLEKSVIGDWRDVYCTKNCVYYEAQIKKVKQPKKATDKAKILFHYKGWSPKYDEWMAYDSDRIQPHHLFTNPDATDPRQQEAWQGRSPVKSTIRSAISISKKRKSGGSDGSSSARKRRSLTERGEDSEEEDEQENDATMIMEVQN